jgi:pyrroline-5-carboxylate reductase
VIPAFTGADESFFQTGHLNESNRNMNTTTIGFIGTGRIARALIAGLVGADNYEISGYDRDPGALQAVSSEFGIAGKHSLHELALSADIIILAVKPYHIEEVLDEIRTVLRADQLLISVAAGITSEFMRTHSREDMHVIRAMPNTPAFVGEGMTAISRGIRATAEDVKQAEQIFSSVGRVLVLDEQQMDAATAVSGSGPAYMFHILASIAQGGKQCGLSAEDAVTLSAQTMLGAAKLVLDSGQKPDDLIKQVTTPGGTTEAGLSRMDAHNVRQAMIDTVHAAAERSVELKK